MSKANKDNKEIKSADAVLSVAELLNLSYACIQQNDLAKAKQHLLIASEIDAENTQIWSNLGVIAKKNKQYQEAIEYYNKGLKINPEEVNLLSNIASLLIQLKDFSQAVNFLKKALSINDKRANVWNNLGSCHFHLGQYARAQTCYEKSLKLEPDNATTCFNLSWCLLRIGEFQRGFTLYEARFQKNEDKAVVKNIHSPRWQRQSLINTPQAKLCITAEQGFGDTLQFIRFIPRLLSMRLCSLEQLVIHVQPECQELIAQSYPELTVLNNQQAEPQDCAFHIPLMSLPLVCHLDPLNIPNVAYLKAADSLKKKWQKALSIAPKARAIGVVWKGSPSNQAASHRSIDFMEFISIFAQCPKEISLVNLSVQEDTIKQLEDFFKDKPTGYEMVSLAKLEQPIKNFADTAAIIDELDLVISIDTSVAHLSGAVSKETFTLIPYAHDWRWFRHINYSPWYPSMRLVRQSKWHDWGSALPALKEKFHQWLDLKK